MQPHILKLLVHGHLLPIGVGFFGAKGLNPFRCDLSEFVNEYMGGGKNTCSLRTYFVGSF